MNLKESYKLLGLPLDASEEEVKRAYKQKAREFHPDKNPDDPEATEKFQTLSQAYERIVSGSSQEPEEHEVFSGFFQFVILREMIERRRREQFVNRVFRGLFDDDTDDEYGDFPFGFFGMPFFHCPSSSRRESSSQQHNYQSRNQRSTQFEGQCNKGTDTEKTGKGRKNQPRFRRFQRNSTSPGQKMGRNEKEANSKSDTGQEKPPESNAAHGETMTSSRSTSEVKERKSPAKAKQKRKNNDQMRASEWQKGRKSKQKTADRKKQQSSIRSSGPSVSKSQEHREQNAVEDATEEAKTQGTKASIAGDCQEECLQTSGNKTCQGTVQHKHFPESPLLKNSCKVVNHTEQKPGSGNQGSWGDIDCKDHKTTSKDVLENACSAMQDDVMLTETTAATVNSADVDWKRGAKGFKQDTNEHLKTSFRAGNIELYQRSCSNKDLNKSNINTQSEKEPESDREKLEAKPGCDVTQHNAKRISFVEGEVESVHKIILNCDVTSKEENVKINEHYKENKQEKKNVFKKETDLLWTTAKEQRVPPADTLNSKDESNLSRTATIKSIQEPATKQICKERSVAGESELNDFPLPSVPTLNHDVKPVPDVEFDSNEETWKAKSCGRNHDNQDTVKSAATGRYKINSAVKDSKQPFDENMSPEYSVENTEHFPAATKRWTEKQDFRVNHKLENSHFETQKTKSAASPEPWRIGQQFYNQMKAGKGDEETGNQENGDSNDVAVEKGSSRKATTQQTKREPSVRQEHDQQRTQKANKGTSEYGEDRYHTKLADAARKKSGENNETEVKHQFECNRGVKLDCDDQGPANRFTTSRNNLPKLRNTAKNEGNGWEGSSDHKWHFPSNKYNAYITHQATFKKDFKQAQNARDESSCSQESKPHGKSEVSTYCQPLTTVDYNPTLESDSKDKKFESNRNEPTAHRKASLCDEGIRRNPTKEEKRQQRRQRKLEEQDSTTIWNSVVSSNEKPWTSNVEANSNGYVKANIWHIMNSKIRAERYRNEHDM